MLAVILGLSVFISYNQLNDHIKELSEYKGKETANKIITDTINDLIQGSNDEYLDIIRDENSKILSIQTDSKAINELQNELRESINKKLINLEHDNVAIPIGTLSGIVFLSGRGPELNLKLHQVGTANTEIKSEFESAGINQTKHRLVLTVTVELTAILPMHSTDITISDDYIISETVIVGNIPSALLTNN